MAQHTLNLWRKKTTAKLCWYRYRTNLRTTPKGSTHSKIVLKVKPQYIGIIGNRLKNAQCHLNVNDPYLERSLNSTTLVYIFCTLSLLWVWTKSIQGC